ncbi:MAG: hypothetical protein ACOC3V_03040, partial [bacterium]
MNKIKRGYIILGFSILLISIIFAFLNSAHDSNDVLININGYSMTLQQAIDNDFLNKSEDPPTENLTIKSDLSGSYHTGDEIFLCINENDMTLNNAINSDNGLSSNVSCSYSSDISFGHLGEEINIEINGDTKSLQESINNGDFYVNKTKPENKLLWVVDDDGNLYSYNNSGEITSHTNMDKRIITMTVYEDNLWLGDKKGNLHSCNNSGECINYGEKVQNFADIIEYNNKLIIGSAEGGHYDKKNLYSCNNSGECTDFGWVEGGDIIEMINYNNELWVGDRHGYLYSCNTSGECILREDIHEEIRSIVVYEDNLWIGDDDGNLYSCNTSGECILREDIH